MIDLSPLFGSEDAPRAERCTFRVFPKTGTERWMLEAAQRRPWHLKTWPRANLRARMIYRIAWLLGAFQLHLPSRRETFSVAAGSVYAQLRAEFDRLGIFLGTPGPNRKIVVYAGRQDGAVFIKIPLGPVSAALIAHESETLNELAQHPDIAPLIPRTERVSGHLALEEIETDGTGRAALDLAELVHIHNLLERRSVTTRPLSTLRADWQSEPVGAPLLHDTATTTAIAHARGAAQAYLDTLPQDLEVPCYMAHGDFTRWNVLRAIDGSVRIIDWELYGLKPRWFDLMHYIVSYDLLVARIPAAEVMDHLDRISRKIGVVAPKYHWWPLVGMYVSCQSLYYCSIYGRQPDLHVQAILQLDMWSEILGLLTGKMKSTIALGSGGR